MEQLPLKDRIANALGKAGGCMTYHALMVECFPFEKYPKAWRYQSNGGPPGCAMAFGRALREMGCRRIGVGGGSKVFAPSNV